MMSDQMMRRLRVQLTTTMDSVLRKAVFEVMTIFENALHDHQMEMAHKGEEVAQLKIKLQAAELRLKDLESSGDRGVKAIQTQTQSEVVLDAPKATSEAPGIEVDVPDDWCAPLGSEVVTKDEDGVCPSVRLRQFSIPLWHIPLWKHKDDTRGDRRSRRISALNATSKLIRDGNSAVSAQKSQSMSQKNDMQRLLQDMKWMYSDLADLDGSITKRKRKTSTKKEQRNPAKHKKEQSTAVSSKSKEVTKVGKKKYPCKFCDKVLDTEIGRKLHVRLHRKCRGCKRMFPFPSVAHYHEQGCSFFKKFLQESASNNLKTYRDESSGPSPCEIQLIKSESAQSSGYDQDVRFSCKYCDCKFDFRSQLKTHIRKNHTCNICYLKFGTHQSLIMHMVRKHKTQKIKWTEPLKDAYDDGKQSGSPRKYSAGKKSEHAGKIGPQ